MLDSTGAAADQQRPARLSCTVRVRGERLEFDLTDTDAQSAGNTNAGAVVLNVTVTKPLGAGFVTVYPCGTFPPNASNLNFTAGATVANAVVSSIGTAGKVCVYTPVPLDLVVDVTGWFP